MLYDDANNANPDDPAGQPRAVPVGGALPAGWVLTERAVAALRNHLRAIGLAGHTIFYCADHDLDDLDNHIAAIDPHATWEPVTGATRGGEGLVTLTYDDHGHRLWPSTFLRIPRYDVVVGRWYWVESDGYCFRSLWLCAAPAPQNYLSLRRELVRLRRETGAAVWQITGCGWEFERTPRPSADEDLVLATDLHDRVVRDVVRFFGDDARRLYGEMKVPYRRGVLLFGPPGNGKTSRIRHISRQLPQVPVLVLRPGGEFAQEGFEHLLEQWKDQAPAMLVIEDLDWLLTKVNVSTFLNLLDGVDTFASGGLLLLATTNHPDRLDAAINNRPGRFDVVVEVPCPEDAQRDTFLRRRLPDIDDDLRRELVSDTDGLSFAHLQEVLRLSGLLAIEGGRTRRDPGDLRRAVRIVRDAHDDATRGFPPRKPEVPFGLAYLHERARRNAATGSCA